MNEGLTLRERFAAEERAQIVEQRERQVATLERKRADILREQATASLASAAALTKLDEAFAGWMSARARAGECEAAALKASLDLDACDMRLAALRADPVAERATT